MLCRLKRRPPITTTRAKKRQSGSPRSCCLFNLKHRTMKISCFTRGILIGVIIVSLITIVLATPAIVVAIALFSLALSLFIVTVSDTKSSKAKPKAINRLHTYLRAVDYKSEHEA